MPRRADDGTQTVPLALTHLSQRHTNALLGKAGLPLFFSLLSLESLDRGEEPRRIRLAIDHGECSFRTVRVLSSPRLPRSTVIAAGGRAETPPRLSILCRRYGRMSRESRHNPVIFARGTGRPVSSSAYDAVRISEFSRQLESDDRFQLQPDVAPQVSHLEQAPLRTRVS
jgi:hypothetical protein